MNYTLPISRYEYLVRMLKAIRLANGGSMKPRWDALMKTKICERKIDEPGPSDEIEAVLEDTIGGSCSLENLQIVSWFENRAKNDMTMDEWLFVKKNIKEFLT